MPGRTRESLPSSLPPLSDWSIPPDSPDSVGNMQICYENGKPCFPGVNSREGRQNDCRPRRLAGADPNHIPRSELAIADQFHRIYIFRQNNVPPTFGVASYSTDLGYAHLRSLLVLENSALAGLDSCTGKWRRIRRASHSGQKVQAHLSWKGVGVPHRRLSNCQGNYSRCSHSDQSMCIFRSLL